MNKQTKTPEIKDAFLGRHLENLSQLIEQQSKNVFDYENIQVPVKSCSTFMCIGRHDEISSADIARELGISHQLVKQKLTHLLKLDLISVDADPIDKRRRLLKQTAKGKTQHTKLLELLPKFEAVYEALYTSLEFRLIEKLELFRSELVSTPLFERAQFSNKQR
ncbi:hypothetical protein NBRC116583_12170 [Arenicella sp. 4NH20-0111]|uniref:MarR family transcriptional regulator n=1 Tax=Arenicella sp. 4NH20-0111 TaxID=3127648 RepID=UPI0031091B4F